MNMFDFCPPWLGDFVQSVDRHFHLRDGIFGPQRCSDGQNGAIQSVNPATTPNGRPFRMLSISSESAPNPQLVSVGLYRKPQFNTSGVGPLVPAGTNTRYIADVKWGSGKGQNHAQVDFAHGMRFSVTASVLTVDLIFTTLDGVLATAPVGPIENFSAEATYNTLSGNLAQFTDNELSIAGGATSPETPIPDFARSLTLSDDGSPTTYLVQFSTDGTTRNTSIVVAPGTRIDIPNGMNFYTIHNNDGGVHGVFPIFLLYL